MPEAQPKFSLVAFEVWMRDCLFEVYRELGRAVGEVNGKHDHRGVQLMQWCRRRLVQMSEGMAEALEQEKGGE